MERNRCRQYKTGKFEQGFSKALRYSEKVSNSKDKRDERLAAVRGLIDDGPLDESVSAPPSPDTQPTSSPKNATAAAPSKGPSRLEKLRLWREEKQAAEKERASRASKPAFKMGHTSAEASCPPATQLAAASAVPAAVTAPHIGSKKVPAAPVARLVSKDARSGAAAGVTGRHPTPLDAVPAVTGAAGAKNRPAPVQGLRALTAVAASRAPPVRPVASSKPAGSGKAAATVSTSTVAAATNNKPVSNTHAVASSRLPRAAKVVADSKRADNSRSAAAQKLPVRAKAAATKAQVPSKAAASRMPTTGASKLEELPGPRMAASFASPTLATDTVTAPGDRKEVTISFAPAFFEFKAPEGLVAHSIPSFNRPISDNCRQLIGSAAAGEDKQAFGSASAATATPKAFTHNTPVIEEFTFKKSCASRATGATPAREWRGRSALSRLAKAATPDEKMDIISRSPLVEMVRRTPRSCTQPPIVDDENANTGLSPSVVSPAPLLFCLPEDEDISDTAAVASLPESKVASDGKASEVQYFKSLLVSQTKKLNELSDKWNAVLCSGDERLTDEVQGQIRTTIGQAQLLIAERFDQFSGLVSACENGTGEKETTTTDLHGFWDMIEIQVQDVLNKFASLDKLQGRGFVPEECPTSSISSTIGAPARRPAAIKGRKRPIGADKVMADPSGGPAPKVAGKSKFALFKEQMLKEQTLAHTAVDVPTCDDVSTTAALPQPPEVALHSPACGGAVIAKCELPNAVQTSASPSHRPRSSMSCRRRSLAATAAAAAAAAATPQKQQPAFSPARGATPLAASLKAAASPAQLSVNARPLQSALRDISNKGMDDVTAGRSSKKALRFSEAVDSPKEAVGTAAYRTTPYRWRASDHGRQSVGQDMENSTSVFSPSDPDAPSTPSSRARRSMRLSPYEPPASNDDAVAVLPRASPGSQMPKRRSRRLSARAATPAARKSVSLAPALEDDDLFAARFLVPTTTSHSTGRPTGNRRTYGQADTSLPLVQGLSIEDCDLFSEVMPMTSPLLGLTPTSPAAPGPSDPMVFSPDADPRDSDSAMMPPPRRSLRRQTRTNGPRDSWLIHF